MHRIGIQILSFERPKYLRKTLESLTQVKSDDDKILVVEQSKGKLQDECIKICQEFSVQVLPLFKNFGQRKAANIAYESGFFNDCYYVMMSDHDNYFYEDLSIFCKILDNDPNVWIATGYCSMEHDIEDKKDEILYKSTCRAGHIVMRKQDYYSVMPADPDAGNAAWFAGYDWWLSHWSPNSPGHKRKMIVAAYPCVEHTGAQSTWQGEYTSDDINYEEMKWIRENNLYDIIKKYPPQHKYLDYQYWYEKVSDEEFKNKCCISSNTNNNKVMAFNYLWPAYGYEFLDISIEKILPYVDKYLLFLNKKSYIGNECPDTNYQHVKDICNRFDKVEIFESDDINKLAAINNIDTYYSMAQSKAKAEGFGYIWLVQSDEVYDDETCQKVIQIINKGQVKEKNAIFQPYCYIDNPHWVINPPEYFTRPSLVNVDLSIDQKQHFPNIFFHHLSYVIRRDDLNFKLTNWGHRDEVQKEHFTNMFDKIKCNKNITNFHPVDPGLYKSVKFVDNEINRELFSKWVHSLIKYRNPYDKISKLFENTVYDFPADPSNMYTLSENERRLIASILQEFLPEKFEGLEIGTWNGMNLLMMKLIKPNSFIVGQDCYINPDKLFGQYGDANFVYQMALKRLISNNIFKDTPILNGWPKKLISILKNNSLDFVFVNPGITPERIQNCLIELWPKLRDDAIVVGHYSIRDDVRQVLENIVKKNNVVDCPWGQDVFNFSEIYYDVFSNLRHIEDLTPQLGMYLFRVNKK